MSKLLGIDAPDAFADAVLERLSAAPKEFTEIYERNRRALTPA